MAPEDRAQKPDFTAPNFSWDEYIKYRPLYPTSFYERIYKYDAEHGNSWEVAHDVGTGPGVVAQELASKFRHVYVSDPNDTYVDVACDRLTNRFGLPKSQFTFLQEGAEESSVQDGAVDLLVIAQAMHWTDVETAMESFARQLKSGGTVAISFYALPLLSKSPRAQEALDKVYDVWTKKLIDTGGVPSRALKTADSAFDVVPFSSEYWKPGVKRILINTEGKKEPFRMSLKYSIPFHSKVGKDDVMEAEEDEEWIDAKDMKWLQGFFASLLENVPEDDVKGFWAEVKDAIGAPDKPVEIVYPVVQLLATRK